jgi:hypothetical protein
MLTDRQTDRHDEADTNTSKILQLPHPISKRTEQNIYLFIFDYSAEASLDSSLRIGYLSVCFHKFVVCLFLAPQPPMGQGLLVQDVFKSHTTTHQSR